MGMRWLMSNHLKRLKFIYNLFVLFLLFRYKNASQDYLYRPGNAIVIHNIKRYVTECNGQKCFVTVTKCDIMYFCKSPKHNSTAPKAIKQ